MMRHYKAEITRDGRWWMISIPEIGQLTQARRISEITEMAQSLIAITTGEPPNEIVVDVVGINVPGMGNVVRSADELVFQREQAAQAAKKAQTMAAAFVRELCAAGVPIRDAAELLHISPQRVSQLANT